jgi:hypothetical protein
MVLIYSHKITPRIEYIFELIFFNILKTRFKLTDDKIEYSTYTGAKICYDKKNLQDGIFIECADLLFEKTIEKPIFTHLKTGHEPNLYPTPNGVFRHDIFAAAFFLVSRYEEYLTHFKDRHGRYKVEDSLAYKYDFLFKPYINTWALELRTKVIEVYPNCEISEPEFSFNSTIDIDNAYAYKYKGFLRSTSACLGLFVKLQWGRLWSRMKVHLGIENDPYDTYKKQHALHKKYKVNPIYFVLLGDYSRNDKNLSFKNPHYITLIKKLDMNSEVGMHPSYKAATDLKRMQTEKLRLEKILGKPVYKSRAHYIRIAMPETYRMLIDVGITHDYSMGYASQPGYRASIANPFYFYDLEKEKKTNLLVHPFSVMDTTLKKYLHIKAKDLMDYLYPLIENTKNAKGNFTFIFHNESMGGAKVWRNWGSVYEDFMRILG